ncbi:MAG: hypothetical protein P8X93_06020, partial [Gammaproteobacteria bacterium]
MDDLFKAQAVAHGYGYQQQPGIGDQFALLLLCQPGLLSERSYEALSNKLRALGKEFTELHRQDSDLPLGKRRNIGL